MTQPRKEQVKNLKTKYSRGPSSVAFGGGPVQDLQGADYTNVLAATKTGVVGGAETSSGAVLTGGQGPYSFAANSSFTIILPGVNGGVPMPVLFLLADFVTLNAQTVMTTSRTVAKINGVVASFGVTTPVAFNVDGRLVLRSANSSGPTFGDESFISLSDVTPGMLQIFGLSVGNQASAVGQTAPKRGLITVSQDGLGGFIQIRNLDSVPTEPSNTSMLHMGNYRYVPQVLPGRPAYARVRQDISAVGLELTYYRTGPVQPFVITKSSNFTVLEDTDHLSITVDFGLSDGGFTFDVSVADMVTVQQVVDEINDQFRLQWDDSNPPPTQAIVLIPVPGPFVFSDPATKGSFFIAFNGNSPIHVNPPAGAYSASDFATYINNQISAAGQTAEGFATFEAFNGEQPRVKIASNNVGGVTSTVAFLPGFPGGTAPGTYMETLNAIGITPGLYRGTHIADLYGLDEIRLSSPSSLPGASITVAPISTLSASRWGLPYSASPTPVLTSTGATKVAVPPVQVILPEMVEFHEERDNYDTEIQDFDNRGDAAAIDPLLGVGNIGVSPLLGTTGKLDPSFIPRILESLGLNQLTLGSNLLKNFTDQQTPRTVYPNDPNLGAVLLWEGVPVQGTTTGIVRMYLSGTNVYLTANARMTGPELWSRDAAGDSSLFEFRSGKGSFAKFPAAGGSTWFTADWQRNIRFNPTGVVEGFMFSEAVLSLGNAEIANGLELKPRVETPIAAGTPTLIFSIPGPSGRVIRVYATADSGMTLASFEATVNAVWNGSQYEKDVTGAEAVRAKFSTTAGFEFSARHAANNTAWSAWDNNIIRADPAALVTYFAGQIRPGQELQDGSTPRVSVTRFNPSGVRRTLLFESPVSDALASIPIRIYLDTSNTGWTGFPASDPGDGFLFTYNVKWDQTLDKWVQDVPSRRSYAYAMLNQRFWLLSKAAGSGPWGDSYPNWDKYCLFELPGPGGEYFGGVATKDGIYRVDGASTFSNPTSITATYPNSLYAKSMVKAWGRGTYQTGNINIIDGFNFSGIGPNAFAWDSGFATALTTARCVVQTVESGNGSGFAVSGAGTVANAQLGLVFTSARFISYFLDFNGNLYSQASFATLHWVVFCVQ